MGREGEEREGKAGEGRERERGEGRAREGTPNILLGPQFQFSRNMPGIIYGIPVLPRTASSRIWPRTVQTHLRPMNIDLVSA